MKMMKYHLVRFGEKEVRVTSSQHPLVGVTLTKNDYLIEDQIGLGALTTKQLEQLHVHLGGVPGTSEPHATWVHLSVPQPPPRAETVGAVTGRISSDTPNSEEQPAPAARAPKKLKVKPTEESSEDVETPDPSAPDPKPKKVATPRPDDGLGSKTIEELLKVATKKGYEEKPFPNGGVRKMRLLNFLRNAAKK